MHQAGHGEVGRARRERRDEARDLREVVAGHAVLRIERLEPLAGEGREGGAAEEHRHGPHGANGRDDRPDDGQRIEVRGGHLVVAVADRVADEVRLEFARHPRRLGRGRLHEHEVEESHVVAVVAEAGRHERRADRRRGEPTVGVRVDHEHLHGRCSLSFPPGPAAALAVDTPVKKTIHPCGRTERAMLPVRGGHLAGCGGGAHRPPSIARGLVDRRH